MNARTLFAMSRTSIPLLASFIILVCPGCATDDNLAQDDFGYAVRHTIQVQTGSPGTSPHGLDGQKAALAFTEYRKDVAKPTKVDAKELGSVTTGTGQ